VVAVGGGGLAEVLADLAGRGVERLLVEGGSGVFTQLLAGGLAWFALAVILSIAVALLNAWVLLVEIL